MATIIKSIPKEDAWAWQSNNYVDGTTVRCTNHQFKSENRSFVSGTIEPHEDHGWTTAKSDYYYLVISGSCEVYAGKNGYHPSDIPIELDETTEFKAGESFMIKAGTTYNYRAGADGLTFVLFMNNLWEEE